MRLTGAGRVWAVGQILLGVDVAAGPAAGLVGTQLTPEDLARPAPVLGASVAFFVLPVFLMLGFGALRARWWVWIGASLPALLWVPAMPFVFLTLGPQLETPEGLALAAAGLVGAVIVVVGGLLAALDAGRGDTA